MTEKAKKREMIENVAEKFLLLPDSDKSFIAGFVLGKRRNGQSGNGKRNRQQSPRLDGSR